MSALTKILAELRTQSIDELHKGKLFERLIAKYLKTDPAYANKLAQVWSWAEWPHRPADWKADNTGIDLVAQTHEGEFWAIQCKFYDDESALKKEHISSFLADSQKVFEDEGEEKTFAFRLFVSTTAKLGKGAEDVILDQPNFGILYLEDLDEAPVDWEAVSILHPEQMPGRKKKDLRKHQEEAIAAATEGFAEHDRGKVIMACGTGKTFMSLRLVEQMTGQAGLVLFLAPSITLVSQTLREWASEAMDRFDAFVVCSDSKVGREEEDIRTAELAYPATTDPAKLARALAFTRADPRRRIVFSTYQSIQAVIDAQRLGALPSFDLVICDEAHRTTGITLEDEGECRILSNARCLSEGVDVPALDAVVFFDTRESMVDIVQSVGRVMRKVDGKNYGYIILPVGMPLSSIKDYNSYIDSDPQFKGIWKVIKALRAHDERLVDEAEFRRKIKVISDPGRNRDGGKRKPGEIQAGFDFPLVPIDGINEAVYAAIPKKLGDREYWSEWAKSVAAIAERVKARIVDLLSRRDARTAFNAFLMGLHKNINPAIDRGGSAKLNTAISG